MKDTQETLFCPACGKDMKKIKMRKEGVFLDVCINGCGGIYFDNRELEKFDENSEDISDLVAAYEGKTFKKVDQDIDRVCPCCGGNFVKNFVSAKREIQIDDCYNCGGKFFDHEELVKMRAQYGNTQERIDDVVNYIYSNSDGKISEVVNKETGKGSLTYRLFCKLTGLG